MVIIKIYKKHTVLSDVEELIPQNPYLIPPNEKLNTTRQKVNTTNTTNPCVGFGVYLTLHRQFEAREANDGKLTN